MNGKEVFVTDSLIQGRALYFLSIVNNSLSESKHIAFNLSNGSLASFKKRNTLCCYWSYYEQGDAEELVIYRELPAIRRHLNQYSPAEVFNANECGLFYQLQPTTTVGPSHLHGRKKTKRTRNFSGVCKLHLHGVSGPPCYG